MEAHQHKYTGEIAQLAQRQAYSAMHAVPGLLLLSCQIGCVACMGSGVAESTEGRKEGAVNTEDAIKLNRDVWLFVVRALIYANGRSP